MKGLVDVGLPLLRSAELLILHQLELVCGDVTKERENSKFVLEIHGKGLLLEWEANKDVFD